MYSKWSYFFTGMYYGMILFMILYKILGLL